jgi:hypothetical protein
MAKVIPLSFCLTLRAVIDGISSFIIDTKIESADCLHHNYTTHRVRTLSSRPPGSGQAQYELANRLAAKPDYPEAMRWITNTEILGRPLF